MAKLLHKEANANINTGRLHGIREECDAIGDQGGGGSIKVEMPNQELLCK
jgi:hypothetical protein